MDWMDTTGDAVTGDTIRWTEGVFAGTYRSAKFIGYREIVGKITGDSYGQDRQQHTFTIQVESSTGEQPLPPGRTIRRKGRNVYRNGTERLPWDDEQAREDAVTKKHMRGDAARAKKYGHILYKWSKNGWSKEGRQYE